MIHLVYLLSIFHLRYGLIQGFDVLLYHDGPLCSYGEMLYCYLVLEMLNFLLRKSYLILCIIDIIR